MDPQLQPDAVMPPPSHNYQVMPINFVYDGHYYKMTKRTASQLLVMMGVEPLGRPIAGGIMCSGVGGGGARSLWPGASSGLPAATGERRGAFPPRRPCLGQVVVAGSPCPAAAAPAHPQIARATCEPHPRRTGGSRTTAERRAAAVPCLRVCVRPLCA